MGEFEFIFALFGLLLGLSITEVLGGFARALEVRLRPATTMRFGWLTPLLALFVLLDLLSFWSAAWLVRDIVFVSRLSLLCVSMFAGVYFLAAYLVFPREPAEHASLDTHFMRIRRVVIGAMLALFLCQIGWYAAEPALRPLLARPVSLILAIILALLMVAAMAVRSERASRWLMAALVGRYLVVYLM